MRPILAVLLLVASAAAQADERVALPACDLPVRFTADWFADPPQELDKSAAQLVALGAPATEGATALGFRYLRTLRLVVIPQAVRLMLPPTVGFMVQIVKSTSVASLIYFALCWPLSLYAGYLERRFAVGMVRDVPQTLLVSAS